VDQTLTERAPVATCFLPDIVADRASGRMHGSSRAADLDSRKKSGRAVTICAPHLDEERKSTAKSRFVGIIITLEGPMP
jgi:hypothetical protein